MLNAFFRQGPFRTLAGLLASNGLILLCGLVTGIITARVLGPHDRGTLAAIFLWPQIIAALGLFSLNEAVLVRLSSGGAPQEIGSALRTAAWLSGPSVIAAVLLVPFVIESEASRIPALIFATVYIPSNFVSLTLLAAEQAHGRYAVYNHLRLAGPAIYLVGALGLTQIGFVSPSSFAGASLLATGTVSLLLCCRYKGFWRTGTDPAASQNWLRFVKSIHPTTVAGLVGAQMDRLVVAAFLDPSSLGVHTVALTVSGSLLGAMTTAAQSYLAPEVCRASGSARVILVEHGLALAWMTLVVVGVALIAICPLLIPALFGIGYQQAVVPAMLATAAYVPFAARQIVIRVLRAVSENNAGCRSESIAIGTFLVLALPLQQRYGLRGVCIALLLANTAALAHSARQVSRHFGVRPADWLVPRWTAVWRAEGVSA